MPNVHSQLPNNTPPSCNTDTHTLLSPVIPYLSSQEFILSLFVIVLTIIALALSFSLLKNRQNDSDGIMRLFVLLFIIGGTLLLIASGYSEKQIATAIGLFGAIVGYLLGKMGSGRPQGE